MAAGRGIPPGWPRGDLGGLASPDRRTERNAFSVTGDLTTAFRGRSTSFDFREFAQLWQVVVVSAVSQPALILSVAQLVWFSWLLTQMLRPEGVVSRQMAGSDRIDQKFESHLFSGSTLWPPPYCLHGRPVTSSVATATPAAAHLDAELWLL